MVLWPGTCIVHEQFSHKALVELKIEHPEAAVAAHPECPEPILALADHVGSTSSILRFVQENAAAEFLIATEPGIIHQMEKLAPGKRFIPVPGGSGECACNVCPYMRRNTLENLSRLPARRCAPPRDPRGAAPGRPATAPANAGHVRGDTPHRRLAVWSADRLPPAEQW